MSTPEEQLALFEHWSQGVFDFSASEKQIKLFAETIAALPEQRETSQRASDRWCRFNHLQLPPGPTTKEDFLFMWKYQTDKRFRYGFRDE